MRPKQNVLASADGVELKTAALLDFDSDDNCVYGDRLV